MRFTMTFATKSNIYTNLLIIDCTNWLMQFCSSKKVLFGDFPFLVVLSSSKISSMTAALSILIVFLLFKSQQTIIELLGEISFTILISEKVVKKTPLDRATTGQHSFIPWILILLMSYWGSC